MIKRFLLLIFLFSCLGWLGFVALDLIERKTDFAPSTTFGLEDGKLLVINRKSEADASLISFSTLSKNNELLQAILPFLDEKDQLIVSAQRKNILISSRLPWTSKRINTLFERGGIELKTKGIRNFEALGMVVSFHKKRLYIRQANLETTFIEGWESFDKQSSACLIEFSGGTVLVKDIYFREENKVEFHFKAAGTIRGKQVNDQQLFAGILPRSLRNYHFLETNFARSTDPLFKMSPMAKWINHGFVTFEYKGQKVLISDYKSGQDPIQLLYDEKQLQSESSDHDYFEGLRLSAEWNKGKPSNCYVYIVNDFVILSEDEAVCIDILTQQKLGTTISSDQYTSQRIYSDMPGAVSERVVNWQAKYTKSFYRGNLLETHILVKPVDQTQESIAEEGTLTIQVEAKIKDFVSFDGKGNAAVLTATGELIYYVSGKTAWMKNLGSKSVGKLVYLESLQFLVATCRNSIHVLDKQGNYVLGGTISVKSIPQTEATAIEFRNRLYFFYPDERGNLVIINSRRQLLGTVPTALEKVNGPIEAWISQNKLFAGIYNQQTFKMIDIERRNEFRSFQIPSGSLAISSSNQFGLFVNEPSGISFIDQKGTRLAVNPPFSGQLHRSTAGKNQQFMICSRGNQLNVYDPTGFTLGNFQCLTQSIEDLDAVQIDGRTFVVIVDGIENNVYLYNVNGSSVIKKAIEGSQKAMLSRKDRQLILTTVVDNYLVQYDVNR